MYTDFYLCVYSIEGGGLDMQELILYFSSSLSKEDQCSCGLDQRNDRKSPLKGGKYKWNLDKWLNDFDSAGQQSKGPIKF